jgi:hypothetical protein
MESEFKIQNFSITNCNYKYIEKFIEREKFWKTVNLTKLFLLNLKIITRIRNCKNVKMSKIFLMLWHISCHSITAINIEL